MLTNQTTLLRNLGILSAFCFALEIGRMCATSTLTYVFLPWNLILAWIPLCIAALPFQQYNLPKKMAVLLVWLVFFPNAPYIITDLVHLRPRNNFPLWFDIMLVYSFAFTGLLAGMLSAVTVYRKLKAFLSVNVATLFMVMAMFLSGYGIYIGRYLRWNSWDVLLNPLQIVNDTLQRVVNPTEYPRTYGVTLVTGLLLCLALLLFESMMLDQGKEDITSSPKSS